jgi:hypothetical protein
VVRLQRGTDDGDDGKEGKVGRKEREYEKGFIVLRQNMFGE